MDFAALSDEALLAKIECLSRTERFALGDFLLHLAELDQRDACRRLGFSSAYSYLTRHLGYAESDAVRRVRAARAAKRFPSVLRMLVQGELHIVGLSMLQPFLTTENYRRVLEKARGKSQREIERLAAALSPAAVEPPDRIRALPSALAASCSDPASAESPRLELESKDSFRPSTEAAETRRLFTFVAGELVYEHFLRARDLLRHKFPTGKMEEIFGEALRRLVDEKIPKETRKGTSQKPAAISRHIPLHVKNEVWARDGGRCSYVGDDGIRCAETGWLEFDHKRPWAHGGRSDDSSNIRLLCRAHNQAEAHRIFPNMDKRLKPG